jgi:uncharacterized membrane protein YeaQ/YmgE (transglycosylase-associated protein family)
MIISPPLAFGFIIATLCGAGFHLIMGGDARRLAFFLVAGWVGFGVGHWVGAAFGITLFRVGQVYVFAGILGSFLALVVARVLSGARRQ